MTCPCWNCSTRTKECRPTCARYKVYEICVAHERIERMKRYQALKDIVETEQKRSDRIKSIIKSRR